MAFSMFSRALSTCLWLTAFSTTSFASAMALARFAAERSVYGVVSMASASAIFASRAAVSMMPVSPKAAGFHR